MSGFTVTSSPATMPPPAIVMQIATHHYTARCLHVVARSGLADHLGDTPRPAEAIAADAGLNADAVERILRLLAMHGIFDKQPSGWAHTPTSSLLRRDHPTSMRDFAIMIGDATNWKALEVLEHSLRTGETAADIVFPGGIWNYYRSHPEDGRQFDAAMTAKSHGDIALVLPSLDLSGVNTIADIGGGRGHFLSAILDAHPAVKGVLFDMPDVVASAVDHPRVEKVGGDFFKGGLPAADLYLMTHILHDWADTEAIAILKNIRQAAPAHARLAVYELGLPEGPEPHSAKTLDVMMLTITGGRERTAREYAALFRAGGWMDAGVLPTRGPMALHMARAE